jgi:hypothetical protein
MASFVNTSLDIIRRHKPRQHHLHSRWGDVGITAPVEGAWSQINNPHLRGEKKYGPGFVPALDIDDKEVLLLNHYDDGTSEDESSADGEREGEEKDKTTDPKALSKTRRLTRILLPSSVNTSGKKSSEKTKSGEFHYTPIRPNYVQEIEEHVTMQNKPGFRYVPTSKHYLNELRTDIIGLGDDEDEQYRHSETDDDADDENESQTQGKGSLKQLKKHRHHQEQLRSHSCEPYISGSQSVTARKPRSRTAEIIKTATRNASQPAALLPSSVTRKSSSRVGSSGSASRYRQYEQSPSFNEARDQSRGRLIQSRTKSPETVLQRSKSTTINRLHRRTMTLEMVGDQEDLWY